MKCSTYQTVNESATPGFPKIGYSSTQTGEPETVAESADSMVGESLFENFADEIDTWARRALAANGFGDFL